MFKRGFLLIFILLLCGPVRANRFSLLKYEVDGGLSSNTVRCVVQDSLGFMWFGTADGLNRFDGSRYRHYHRDNNDHNTLGNSSIYSLYVAPDRQMWVGTAAGVYLYDPASDVFRFFDVQTPDHVQISSRVNTISDDGGDCVWIGTQGQGVFIFDRIKGTLIQSSRHTSMVSVVIQSPGGGMYVGSEVGSLSEFGKDGVFRRTFYYDDAAGQLRNAEVTALCAHGDTLWFGMGVRGLRALTPANEVRSYEPDDLFGAFHVTALLPISERELLIGTNSGMYVFNTGTCRFSQITDTSNPFGTYHHSINKIYRDREGGIWIASEYGGVHYLRPNAMGFEQYLSGNTPGSKGGMIVTSFCEDRKQNKVWVGTVDGGLFCFNASTGASIALKGIPFIANIQCLMLDQGELWVGTAAEGIYVLNPRTGHVVNHRHRRYAPSTISDNSVTALLRDRKGSIYVGTAWGLNRYDRATRSFSQESRANNQANISQMIEDKRGNIWIATCNIGAFRYTPDKDAWRAFSYNASRHESLRSNNVLTLHEDRRGRIWFGTEKGLCYYTYKDNFFTHFDPQGLASGNQLVAGIVQDRNGKLWISGNAGLFSIDIVRNRVENSFNRADGLQSNQFNSRACLRGKGGKLYFGGVNGFNTFNPGDFTHNTYLPRVLITNMYVNSVELIAGSDDSPLGNAVYETSKLRLKSTQNSVAFDFAAFSYQAPFKNTYRYRLTGWEEEWVKADNRTHATYSNLPPGKYCFEVIGSNNDGLWSEQPAQIELVISPPFYRATVAYVIYLLLFAGGIAVLVVMQNRRHHRLLKEYAVEQEKATYQAKIDFFTNLAHEIRTPLSLIKAPLERIVQSGDGSVQTRNYLDIMARNADNLLNLINQLLDIRRMESVNYELRLVPCNLTALIQEVCIRFRAATETSGLTLETSLPDHVQMCCIDRDAMTKVLGNLLANAVKYASTRVCVTLMVADEHFRIVVTDDGPGVDQQSQHAIFKVFYRAGDNKTGTGLGLPLARLLAEKHGGSLGLLPSEQGASFEVIIPFEKVIAEEEILQPLSMLLPVPASTLPTIKLRTESDGREESVSVLVVEDNAELRGVVSDILSTHYSVLTACNGRHALELLAGEDAGVDLIVSDLMMPEMDGNELCELVKSDLRYSHIPVILLTAKTSLEDRIKGLEYGADAYIEKPFSPDHLLVQIRNLHENRLRLRTAYGGLPQMGCAHIAGTSRKDSEFMEKLNARLLANIGNENFYIESLAESLFMSRSNFYRKVKALLGVSPNEYLRTFRLEQAACLLRTGEYAVSDIYMHVGFNSISYFSSCFKKHFGVAPTKYIEDCNAEKTK